MFIRAGALRPIKSPKGTSIACPQSFQERHIKVRKGTSTQRNPQVHGPILQYQVDAYSTLKYIHSYGRYYSKREVHRNFSNLNTMATATWDQLFLLVLRFCKRHWYSIVVYLYLFISIYFHLRMSLSIYIYKYLYASMDRSIYLSIYLSICLSFYLEICFAMHLYFVYSCFHPCINRSVYFEMSVCVFHLLCS